MLFNSFEYFAFFATVVVAYFCMPYRWRIWFLLAASYFFYMRWHWKFIFLIVAQTLINYICGYLIGVSGNDKHKKIYLSFALVASLTMLGIFKYFNFFNDSFRSLFEALHLTYMIPHLKIILPVGISFFTFQTLSYTIDVYRGSCRVEKHFVRFALYVSFFPQLVAGPIERATHLLGQFKRKNQFDIARLSEGMKLIAWGLFKKVVIADRLADYVTRVYDSPDTHSGATLLVATYFFAFQIYCDFSGYSDIAIGSARILGYDLMQNFRLPYFATSISDFWKRWHISLSTWFADYLYLPLGGNRVTLLRWLVNIFVVFLISGLWHGANWTFVVWGALHGLYYLTEKLIWKKLKCPAILSSLPKSVLTFLRITLTFHLVVLAWVFFRAQTISDACLIVTRIFTDLTGSLYMGPSQMVTCLSVCLIMLLIFVQLLQSKGLASLYFSSSPMPVVVRWGGYIAMVLGLALLAKGGNEFIYFQF